ncbi:unnamed protein product [Spirodela intermedia]|uniref:non-specific serine/threonine protein kinase n=1 Tax=Spirodela intermedia TaxID=51605 RepID=A0A7I8IQG6_SPIIN|nr:unnamed protein product [Spirodela intermedia]CAA6659231.1 unnamed protein product [Spirodela intermedia]
MISRHELMLATGGFSEENLLGSGGFGRVYRGALADGTPVAVKVFDLLKMGEAAWRSFDAECKVMRSVRHRNLVSVITTCSNLDFRAIVLPLMPNGSLESWLHGDLDGGAHVGLRLSFWRRVAVAADVAAALEYLHHGCSPAVVHCDLKPSNVLLDADMDAHLGDFGIAKVAAEHATSATLTSAAAPGTFGYMAPEYGTAARVTTRGDVYSYGILLLEMFTGVRPTDGRFAGGGWNLRRWVAAAFPDSLADVVDPRLLEEDDPEETSSVDGGGSSRSYGSDRREVDRWTATPRRSTVAPPRLPGGGDRAGAEMFVGVPERATGHGGGGGEDEEDPPRDALILFLINQASSSSCGNNSPVVVVLRWTDEDPQNPEISFSINNSVRCKELICTLDEMKNLVKSHFTPPNYEHISY